MNFRGGTKMIRKRNGLTVFLGLAAVLGLLVPSAAQAAILAPGDGPVAPDVFASAPTGAVLATLGPTDFTTGTGKDSGTLLTAVVEDTPGGTLDFLYQWTANAGNVDNFTKTSANLFAGWATDVGYIVGAAALGADLLAAGFTAPSGATIPVPTSVQRSAPSGDSVDWAFGQLFNPGDKTTILIIKTNARAYTDGISGILDGSTANVPSFSPAIPEPASILVWMGFGLASFFFWRRRR
jgi:hypothetical protein